MVPEWRRRQRLQVLLQQRCHCHNSCSCCSGSMGCGWPSMCCMLASPQEAKEPILPPPPIQLPNQHLGLPFSQPWQIAVRKMPWRRFSRTFQNLVRVGLARCSSFQLSPRKSRGGQAACKRYGRGGSSGCLEPRPYPAAPAL